MRKFVLILLLCLSLNPLAWAQNNLSVQPSPAAITTDETRGASDLRHQTFDVVWRTVKEKHFDPTLGGVNWDKVREKYEPRLAALADNNALYGLLQEMLGELHQSHFNIIPPEAITPDDVKEPPTGGIGIDVRLIDGQVVVVHVEPQSTASAAGIKTGFIVTKVNDVTVAALLEKALKRKESPSWTNLRVSRGVMARINGEPDSSVTVKYLDERNREHEATLRRERLHGEMSKKLGNFPPQYTEFEARRLPGNIGYIRFNTFALNLMDKIRESVRAMNDTSGIIFDLRGNPGGVGGMASAIGGLLSDRPILLGTMKMRASEIKFQVFPQNNANLKPVVILIDASSGSTSEIFASGMQEVGRAIVVGERSIGAALPSTFVKLPTGALFQFAIGDFRTPKGILIEGRGVIPDVEVKWNRARLLEGRDTQLEEAMRQIQKHAVKVSAKGSGEKARNSQL
jgi:carboxyl-terminal processing protease